MKLKSRKNFTFFHIFKVPNTLSSRINSNENQHLIKIIYLINKLYTNYEIKIQMKLYTTQIKIKHICLRAFS